ncbi:LacI family DNA-binding transcriptional regulator [Microbacterium suwonense]|uniref:LacI family transcriptional regulator n=1 Tax=Microbacterium suwonense TaxID=683047 RepID=A0ABN6X442_9MICO|nr:LacI family DNA-binding transcriptional regulator [Microbacterium suwonense]BDZ39499.1 LacI family transcriptional regulator [Microbacterium suwonense]
MTTMQDVAAHAGVSAMTVSNVINGHAHVRDSTRRKVLASISELGYHVNTTARNLRQGRTGVIALAVPEIDRPYFGMLASMLIDRAAARGFELVVEQTAASRDREFDAISRSRLRNYDGLILSAVELHDDDAVLLRGDFPIVVLGERAFSGPLDHVVMANEDGAALAAGHLLDQGCRIIAMLGGYRSRSGAVDVSTSRLRGFEEALRASGADLPANRVRSTPFSFEGGKSAMTDLLADVPDLDGVFCSTDVVAIGATRALTDAGRRVPDDVKVVGFDDVPLASFLTPSLTTIAADHPAMADAVIAMLIDRIEGKRAADDYRTVVGSVRLIERESTAL